MIRLRNFCGLALASVLLGYQANAQSNLNQFVRGGVTDAGTLLEAYVAPAGASIGANLNAGWTNTATTLLPGRFEFKIVGNATYIPKKRRSYDLNALGLDAPQAVNETSTSEWQYANPQAPTVFGTGEETSTIRRVLTYQTSPGNTEQTTLAEITLPTGLDLAINPISPALQFSIGVPLETEVMVRFLPGANTEAGRNGSKLPRTVGRGAEAQREAMGSGLGEVAFQFGDSRRVFSNQSECRFSCAATGSAPRQRIC